MADHAALEGYAGNNRKTMNERLDALRSELADTCPDSSLIGDIADASKHARLSVAKKALRHISTTEQLNRPPGIFGAPFGTAVFGEASWVMVTLDDGRSRPLTGVARQVLMMGEAKLFPVGPLLPIIP
jgi:hypothetical protein